MRSLRPRKTKAELSEIYINTFIAELTDYIFRSYFYISYTFYFFPDYTVYRLLIVQYIKENVKIQDIVVV